MDKRRLLWLFNKGRGLVYLLRDEFTTDDAAPITNPRTCEPGPGTLTINDANSYFSISGGKLVCSNSASNGQPSAISQDFYARESGLCLMQTIKFTGIRGMFGFTTTTSPGLLNDNHWRYQSDNNIYVAINTSQISLYSITLNSTATFFTIAKSSGALFISVVSGNYILQYVDNSLTNANLYAGLSVISTGAKFEADLSRIFKLSSPFDTDYGIATNRVASPAVNETTTSEANAFIEMTWTAVTGETWEFMTRRTDDNNCWIVRCSQSGSTIKLIEKNAGVETERISAAQTWTNGTSYRLVVIQDGNTIRTYVANTAKNTYTSASFNNTATGVKTNKAGSNLVTYPRTLSGAALTELQRWTS